MKTAIMKHLAFVSLFILAGCSALSVRMPNSLNESEILISLDSHVHIESDHGYENALNNPSLGHSFLISPSYNIILNTDYDKRSSADATVSSIVSTYPMKFSGLCGANLSWADVSTIVGNCLKMPGMIGIKIHDLAQSPDLSNTVKFSRLNQVVDIMKGRSFVMLWHLRSDPATDQGELKKEIQELITMASAHKNINLIFAHAIDSLDETSHLQIAIDILKQQKSRPENVYADLSGTMDICEGEPRKEKIKIWERFGFDYLLLGSDSSARSWPGQILLEEELSVIGSGIFSEQDKNKILTGNGIHILAKVNPAAHRSLLANISGKKINFGNIPKYNCESLKDRVRTF